MAIDDVLIVGAGPAGSIAGTILARAGVRVRLIDRATFPRDKLCGDTINPGTMAILKRLDLAGDIDRRALRIDGMVVTGEGGIAIAGRYPPGLSGRAIVRRELDWLLLQQAMTAGCRFDAGVAAHAPFVDGNRVVTGVEVRANGRSHRLDARITIAADGRRSAIGFGLRLASHPRRPRRWAVGAYFERFPRTFPISDANLGEMHVRRGRYIGVAEVPGGLTNVCLVKPVNRGEADLRDPAALLADELSRDRLLADRFAAARLVAGPVVLGPLAVDVHTTELDGLLFAGDAAGFIDPITGDGLRFAICGGELAAAAAIDALTHGWARVHANLAAERRRAFRKKWRFNRALRVVVGSPRAVSTAAFGARLAPAVLRAVIARAGDCDIAC